MLSLQDQKFKKMTKYLLHGGITSTPTKENNKFIQTLIKDIQLGGTIVAIFFAIDESRWNDELNDFRKRINAIREDIHIEAAQLDKNIFEIQLGKASAIHIRGGENSLLRDRLKDVVDIIEEHFKDKVVSASSAGPNILAKYYYDAGSNKIREGLGILPIKVITHYDEKQKEAAEKLQEYKEDLEMFLIPEEHFVIKEIS